MNTKLILLYSCLFFVSIYICYWFDKNEGFSNPSNSTTAIVCVLHPGSGFFSQFFFLCKVYLFAKEQGSPFFIEHENWQYTYEKGWHDYFTTLTVFKDSSEFNQVKKYRAHTGNDIPEYTIQQYVECIKEIFILNDSLNARVEEFIGTINDEYTSLYIRRGDKVNEMPLVPVDDILKQADIQDNGSTVFLQTDDFSVVEHIKNTLPSCNIMTLTPNTKRGANNVHMLQWSPQERKEDTEELLVSAAIFVRAKRGWTYYHSNVGTFHKLFAYETVNFYVDHKHTKEEVNAVYALNHKGNPYGLI